MHQTPLENAGLETQTSKKMFFVVVVFLALDSVYLVLAPATVLLKFLTESTSLVLSLS